MSPSNLYLRFISLRDALANHDSTEPSIDASASKLLEVLAAKHWLEKTMTVTEAMALTDIASPATIHRKLQDLVRAQLVELVFTSDNKRTKYLHPTRKALKQFEGFGKLMLLASSQTKQQMSNSDFYQKNWLSAWPAKSKKALERLFYRLRLAA